MVLVASERYTIPSKILKNANRKYPGAKQKITLRNGLALKAVVLEKRTDSDGNAFWSVITSVPASMNKVQGWGTPEKVKSPTILDPVAATSTEGYYTTLPDSLSQASVLGLPNSEWLDVSNPDVFRLARGDAQGVDRPRLIDPVDATSTESCRRDGAEDSSLPGRQGLLKSERFDVTDPDGKRPAS